MSGSLKRKSQSLPRLRKVQFQSKSQSLIKLLSKDLNSSKQQLKQKLETQQHHDIIDPQQRRKQQVQSILLKSKTMILQNKDKIQVAKKFRILKRKSVGPFLTGVDIYKQQQQNQNPYSKAQHLQPQYKSNDSQLQKMLSQKYDNLAELRKMIRKTNKNLGQYKKQTLNIQKNLITMADKYHDVAIDVMSRRKIGVNVENYEQDV